MAKQPRASPKSKQPQDTQQASPTGTKNGLRAPMKERNTMKINFAAVADSFEPRKAGEYVGTLVEHTINPASASSGQPTLQLKWSEEDGNGFMFRTYSLQPKALWSLKRDLVRIGKQREDFIEELNSEDVDLDELIKSLYGYQSTLVYGDPRPYTATNKQTGEKEDRLGDNMLEVKDPDAE